MTIFRSGFAAVVGRPNVGKSTLVNRIVGTKVSIMSPRPNTTRSQVRGSSTGPMPSWSWWTPPASTSREPRSASG